VAVNSEGRREVLGLAIGPSEAETFWTDFLRSLTRRGLRGVKLVISDAYEGLKAAAAKVLNATWQRCRIHFMRNALAHVAKGQRDMVAAVIRTAFVQENHDAAVAQWRQVADSLRPRFEKLAELMDEAEQDVLAFMTFPKDHRTKIHSTNPLERLNKEVKRRTHVVGLRGLTPASPTVLLASQPGRHHPPGRRHPARAERRVGRLSQIHDTGNSGADQPS